ncbi:MAG: O-antigen ligase family protein, partial [Bacteroidota bacterium]
KKYRTNSEFLFFLPFLSVAILAMVFSPLINLALVKTISFALLYFVCFHYIYHKFQRYGRQLIGDIVYLCHAVLFLGLLLLPILPFLVSYGGVRFNGLLGNPNGMGVFLTLITPITLYYFQKDKSISRRYRTLAWFAILLSLTLCSSRNAIFSFALFLTLHQAFSGSNIRRLIFFLVVIPSVAVVVYNIELESVVYNLGLEKYFRVKDFESGSGRIFAWQHALELFAKNPVIGCGFACEEYNFIFRTTFRLWKTGHQGGVHNSYLAYLVNTGVIGFILFGAFWINICRKIKEYKFLIPYLAAVCFSAMFETWMFSSLSAFHIFFLVTMIWLLVESTQPQLLDHGELGEIDQRVRFDLRHEGSGAVF